MGNSSYELRCLSSYIEEHGMCEGHAPTDMKGWVEMVQKSLDKENPEECSYSAEEIVETLVSTCLDKINPVNDQTIKLSKLITEYCLKWSEMTVNGNVIRPPYVMNASDARPSWAVWKQSMDLTAVDESEVVDALAKPENEKRTKKGKKELTEDEKKALLEDKVKKENAAAEKDARKKAQNEIKKFTAKEVKTVDIKKIKRHQYIFNTLVDKAEADTTEKLEFVYGETSVEVVFDILVSGEVKTGKAKTDVESKEQTYTITKSIIKLPLANDSSLQAPLLVEVEKDAGDKSKVKAIRVTDKDGKELSGLKPDFKNGSLIEIADIDKGIRFWRFEKNDGKIIKRLNLKQIDNSVFWGNYYMSKRYEEANYSQWTVRWDESEEDGAKKRSASKLLEQSQTECKKKRDNLQPSRDYQFYGESSVGKAHPDCIKYFLENFYSNHTGSEMLSVLENFCIGIDCSGFVSRTIAYVLENLDYDFSHSHDDRKSTEANLMAQYKSLGLHSGDKFKDEDIEKYHVMLSKVSDRTKSMNTAATFFKSFYDNPDDTAHDYVYKVTFEAKSKTDKTLVPVYNNKEAMDTAYSGKPDIDDNLESSQIMGSRLIFRFKNGKLDRINKFINPEDDPQITSLRPGDIVTMALDQNFKDGFHIAIVCNVGIDLDGPYFITADSSPSTIAESVNSIGKKKKKAAILKRPDSSEPVDISNLSTNQNGSGVRYVLHRDFKFFDVRPFLAFRRPYAFDRYYRNV